MDPDRDPIERGADEGLDLQNVVTWEPRSALDRVAVRVHASIRPVLRGTFVALSAVLFVGLLSSGLVEAAIDPTLRVLVVLSVLPAALLVAYVWLTDVTTEPATLMALTLVLGVLVAPVAGIVNSGVQEVLFSLGVDVEASLAAAAAYFFLIVAVGEETVKLLAVRLYAFRDRRFDTVVDGAVYGAVAGLGFALIENALYIATQAADVGGAGGVEGLAAVAALRALAGPGHVIYSGIAGYYLGLAKFNREHAGPVAVKGLLIAVFLHGSYNTLVTVVPEWLVRSAGLSPAVALIGFVLAFDGVAGYFLYRKLKGYRRAYRTVYGSLDEEPPSEMTEFDARADRGAAGGSDRPVGRDGTGTTPAGRPRDRSDADVPPGRDADPDEGAD